MALTAAESLSVFEILEAFWDTTASVTDGYGIQLTLTELSELKTGISTRLAALDAASLIKVSALVVEWDAISSATLSMDGGSIGSLQGVKLDFKEMQARIRKRLQTYVPVLHMADAIKHKRGPVGSQSAQIPFYRN